MLNDIQKDNDEEDAAERRAGRLKEEGRTTKTERESDS